jgi:NAD(P)-dependent dehydrogenase (short-subunit alcohol dehydrogenase family)
MPSPERTVLVTGGTGALGTAVTQTLLDRGWRVVDTWRAERELEHVVEHPNLELVHADLLDEDGASTAVAAAAGDAGAPLRGVVNLVGGFTAGPRVHETDPADFERMLTLNLRPTFLVTRAAIPHLLGAGGGSIVCTGARAAVQPFRGAAAYVAAKAAVMAFACAVAEDYRDDDIRCNCVLPSVIDTPANRKAMPDADHSRWVPPEEIARVVAFLVSDDSHPTSGTEIPVYGRA